MKYSVALSIVFLTFILFQPYSHGQESKGQSSSAESGVAKEMDFAVSPTQPLLPFPQNSLTIPDALAIALKNNPDIKIAFARIQQANESVHLADAAFLPYLGFYSQYAKSNAPSTFLFRSIDQRLFKAGTDFNQPGVIDDYQTGLQAELNLYNGGKDSLNKKIAQSTLAENNTRSAVVKNQLGFAVVAGYFDCLAALDYIAIANESVAIAKEQLRVMQVRFEQGDVLKSDILSLQLRLAQAEENVIRAKNRLAIAKASLAVTIGSDPDLDFTLLAGHQMPELAYDNYEKAVRVAVDKRPELMTLKHQLETASFDLEKTKGEYLPEIKAAAKLYYDDPDMDYNHDRNNWTVSLIMNWDLFTGNSTKAKKRRAAAFVSELLEANQKTILQVKLEVKRAILNLAEAEARLKTSDSQVEMAKESLALVKKQYRGGSTSVTRYLEAEQDFNNAKISLTSSSYDKHKAIAEVYRATGVLLDIVFNEKSSQGVSIIP